MCRTNELYSKIIVGQKIVGQMIVGKIIERQIP